MVHSRTRSAADPLILRSVLAAGLLALAVGTARADRILVFSDDFEQPVVRPEWTGVRLDREDSLSQFAGRLGDEQTALTLPAPAALAGHEGKVTYYLRFDLFTLDVRSTAHAPAPITFEVQVGDRVMFSNIVTPAADAQGRDQYPWREPDLGPRAIAFGPADDSVYRSVYVVFQLNPDQAIDLKFRAEGLGNVRPEDIARAALNGEETPTIGAAWGIDNVSIWCDIENSGGSVGRETESPFVDAGSVDTAFPAQDWQTPDTSEFSNGVGNDPFNPAGDANTPRPPDTGFDTPAPKGELMPPGGGGGRGGRGGGGGSFQPPRFNPDPPDAPDDPGPDPDTDIDPEPDPIPAPASLPLILGGLAACNQRRRAA